MATNRFLSILAPALAELRSYGAHPGDFAIRLDSNEAPSLFSADACAALARTLAPGEWNRYPDPRATELRAAIAARSGVSPDEILPGTASDELIVFLLTALCRPREPGMAPVVLTTSPTFVMYRHCAIARGFDVVEVPLDEQWDLDVDAMCRTIEQRRPNLIFIASPNNPTSGLVSLGRLEQVIAAAPESVVVIDEAYVDFASHSQLHLRSFPNVVILRTLSKIGLASLRVGWAIGPSELLREVDKVRLPFNISAPSQRAATFVLRELGAELARIREAVIGERERLAVELRALGLSVARSDANFLWVETPSPAALVFEALMARGILVKSYAGDRLMRHLRVTVGLRRENDALLAALR